MALDHYPGRISRTQLARYRGTMLPSTYGCDPTRPDPHQALGQFAVRIHLDDEDHEKFPIGAHGGGDLFRRGAFAALRRISVRAYH